MDIDNTCLTVIGGGKMGEALIAGILRKELLKAEQITVGEPDRERRRYLQERYAISAVADNGEAVAMADIVLLAVKPQVLPLVLRDLQQVLEPDTLLVSIVAGAKISTLRQALRTPAVVRVMPNTPGQVGEGISVWMSTEETSEMQKAVTRRLVQALGPEMQVQEEKYLDMATALSGSGPAYVFLFAEALTDAGVRMGFTRSQAQKLALQTVRGAAVYAQETSEHLAVLRNRVTSPGGTTAEALQVLEREGFRAAIVDAVTAAYQKARALGEGDE